MNEPECVRPRGKIPTVFGALAAVHNRVIRG